MGAAQREAIRTAGRIIADSAGRMKLGGDWTMDVTDEAGLILFHLDVHLTRAATASDPSSPEDVAA